MISSPQAILCRYNEESQKHAALSLSKEHNPTQYEERMRIQKAGGNVRYQGLGSSREGEARPPGRTCRACVRAFGLRCGETGLAW